MTIQLNDAEARVLAVLIEKAMTTPDGYPLSLNSTVNGCNQKSNRNPVTTFVEAEVVVALQGLTPKGLAGRVIQAGSRVEKFRHTANATLALDDAHLAVLAELLMRGPQAQGELRARAHRMAPTPSLPELKARLEALIEAGYVERAAPAEGTRAERYVQRLCPGLHPVEPATTPAPIRPAAAALAPNPMTDAPNTSRSVDAGADAPPEAVVHRRVERLEQRVDQLSAKLDMLLVRLGES